MLVWAKRAYTKDRGRAQGWVAELLPSKVPTLCAIGPAAYKLMGKSEESWGLFEERKEARGSSGSWRLLESPSQCYRFLDPLKPDCSSLQGQFACVHVEHAWALRSHSWFIYTPQQVCMDMRTLSSKTRGSTPWGRC